MGFYNCGKAYRIITKSFDSHQTYSSSRYWQIFIDRLDPYPDHICNLLPGGAVLQHAPAALHKFFGHYPATDTYPAAQMSAPEKSITNYTGKLPATGRGISVAGIISPTSKIKRSQNRLDTVSIYSINKCNPYIREAYYE